MKELKFNPNFDQELNGLDQDGFFKRDLNCFEDSAYDANPYYGFHLTTGSALKGIEENGFRCSSILEANYFSKESYGGFYLLASKAAKVDWGSGEKLVLIVVDLESLLKNNDPDLCIDQNAYRLINDAKTPPIIGYADVPDFILKKYGIKKIPV